MTPTLTRRAFLSFGASALLCLALGTRMARAEAQTVTVMDADTAFDAAKAGEIILVDIRTPDEWAETGVAEGAIGLDMTSEDFVASLARLRETNPATPIALICRTGNRTGFATQTLAKQGFPGLVDIKEGMAGGRNGTGWLKRGLPTYPGAQVQERTHARLGQHRGD
ncbi:rhodanese-like domain-containing protein [Sagittula salina]|uniref:Rhodanese-like domain-containing protein n=1 Tax=Sagittula salina TaxID=2820268 RepID=A0A940MPG2_9RHOB|nr:rhodanese-like domain-containing protein [Sagittula salina]MBP0481737.1 rhodanese-like domain-containing protein [Sagittula salina]